MAGNPEPIRSWRNIAIALIDPDGQFSMHAIGYLRQIRIFGPATLSPTPGRRAAAGRDALAL